MNERIKELIEQATTREKGPPVLNGYDSYNSEIILFDKEKFSELIVLECAQLARDTNLEDVEGGDNDVLRAAKLQILEHFGVEG